jgi:hypothetical protein
VDLLICLQSIYQRYHFRSDNAASRLPFLPFLDPSQIMPKLAWRYHTIYAASNLSERHYSSNRQRTTGKPPGQPRLSA